MERLIFLDTETTGFGAGEHRLVEIGAVEAVARTLTGTIFQTYLNPERACDAGAFAVHQLADDFLVKQPKFADKVGDFLKFIHNATLVIHNAGFDMGFINAELKRLKKPALTNKVIDTLSLARGIVQGLGNYKLDTLCDHYSVDRSHRVAHGALLDAELLAEVYLRMTRTQGGLDLQSFDHLKFAKHLPSGVTLKKINLTPISVSDDEKQAHALLQAKLGSAHLWR